MGCIPQKTEARSLAALHSLASLCAQGRFGAPFDPDDLFKLARYCGGPVTMPGFATAPPLPALSDRKLSSLASKPPADLAATYAQFQDAWKSVFGGKLTSGDAAASTEDTEPDVRVLEPLIASLETAEADPLLARLLRSHPVFGSKQGKGKKAVRTGYDFHCCCRAARCHATRAIIAFVPVAMPAGPKRPAKSCGYFVLPCPHPQERAACSLT